MTAEMEKLVAALRDYEQADDDGVFCIVSRQAVDEAATLIAAIAASGGKVLFREPTEEMLAAMRGTSKVAVRSLGRFAAVETWQTMFDAAPALPQAQKEEG